MELTLLIGKLYIIMNILILSNADSCRSRVEYNASARAMDWLTGSYTLKGEQAAQAKEALSWAARTYLVAALSAVVTLIYYIGIARRE